MQTQLCYSSGTKLNGRIEELVRDKKLIPHRIHPGEKLIRNEKYYDGHYDKMFRVISVEYKDDYFVGAYIKYEDNNYAWISTELNMYEDYYLTYDINNVSETDIINNKHIYSGAEIRYWFFINNISIFNRKYSCFWPMIDPSNPNSIDDNFTYAISANTDENGNYIKPRLTRMITNEYNINSKVKQYWDKLEKRDAARANNKRKRRKP